MAAMDDTDPFDRASRAAAALADATGVDRHELALVLGSGWGEAVDLIGATVAEVAAPDLPGFPPSTVPGHGGTIRSLDADGVAVLAFLGRVHGYEGHPPSVVVHGVRTAAAGGCRAIVLTNAAGSLREQAPVGSAVLIADHINLTGVSPLTGPEPPPPYGSRFCDLTEAWSPRLRALALELEPSLQEGVYAAMHGPNYETPAEIAMLRTMGADLVGMSTVLEAIAARHLGLEVMGVSLVTNLAAGLSPEPLDHGDVLAASGEAGDRLGRLLAGIVRSA
jgi:purine-nucleoside phosphorylase